MKFDFKKIIAVIFIVAAAASFFSFSLKTLSQERVANDVVIEVEEKEGISEIGSKLAEKQLIHSQLAFWAYSLISGSFSDFKPGIYYFSKGMKISEMVKKMTTGPDELEVVIFPGMTLREIDELMVKSNIFKKSELTRLKVDDFKKEFTFLEKAKSLEGFLMPDTYKFKMGSSPESLVKTMLDNFARRNVDLLFLYDKQKIVNLVTIASLIEKEVVSDKDRELVSGVIQNRTSIGMPLQIDAAVVYGVCQGKFSNCDEFSSESFKKDNPYNLYIYKGLPPTAISNPSSSSLRAAIRPKKSNYLYYLSDRKTGRTIFSQSLEEHSFNRKKYLGL